jgi:hypothetical protein
MQTIANCKMQVIPKPGQIIVSIELSGLQNHSIEEALAIVQQLGYEPQLRYLESNSGFSLYALLLDEQHDPNRAIDSLYRVDETIALFEAFPGDDMAIRSSRGCPQREAVAA